MRALWDRRSVRAQLLIVFLVIEFVAALVQGGVTILKARTSTRVEIAASMELAQLLVSEAVALMQQEVPAEKFLSDLSSRLRLVRHVRIAVSNAAGHPLAGGPPVLRGEERAPAPAWFASLIASPGESRMVPVLVKGTSIGSVSIVGEPRDEIAEVWENSVALAVVTLAVNLAVVGMLYLLFGRVLDPLTELSSGLADLEHRNYKVRLRRPHARELAAITDRFNALAEALETARAENQSLNRRVITAQDDERRRTALDLHDEVGPSLFGLKANATSIANAVREGDSSGPLIKERVRDVLAIIEHLQTTNRSLLNRLRPMALGHVPLRDILAEMVHERARQHPQVSFAFSAQKLDQSYGDSIDLTLYRCVQESLTNVIRHAQAKQVTVDLAELRDGEAGAADGAEAMIRLTVRDDGLGIGPGTRRGFGISGMQERVEALGGDYEVESRSGAGTCVRVAIPLRGGQNGSGRPQEEGVAQ